MSKIKARPTTYKGITMRSRLEADYAAVLDQEGRTWSYEPACFADESGQWLPDFRVGKAAGITYVELKPAYLMERQDGEDMRAVADRIDATLQQMAIAWHSEPDAWLELTFWVYDLGDSLTIVGHPSRPWAAFVSGLPFPLVWSGMGQLDSWIADRRALAEPS